MPTFFNKKEDVIDLKLTRYGRHLLSMGKFRPEYYSFFDSDIIYDSQYGGHEIVTGSHQKRESQNYISKRIKETPRIKTQTVFGGVETEVKELIQHIRGGKLSLGYGNLKKDNESYTLQDKEVYDLLSPKLQQNVEKTMISAMPLGQSALGGVFRPAWDIRAYKTPISSSIAHYQGAGEQIASIPQLEMDHSIHTFFQNEGEDYFNGDFPEDEGEGEPQNLSSLAPNEELNLLDSGRLSTPVYPDGTYIIQQQNYVFLDVVERNTDFSRENFDIEVFKIETNPDGSETMFPLSFFVEDRTTLETPENILNENFPTIDDSYVEYYFNVNVDKEIDEETLCDIDLKDKKRGFFIDYQLEYTCPDDKVARTYTRSIVDPEEPC
tara:strand:+ start:10833 stop:11972 length:1140 start_codon:yes stop_codon:yes gene_type:complete